MMQPNDDEMFVVRTRITETRTLFYAGDAAGTLAAMEVIVEGLGGPSARDSQDMYLAAISGASGLANAERFAERGPAEAKAKCVRMTEFRDGREVKRALDASGKVVRQRREAGAELTDKDVLDAFDACADRAPVASDAVTVAQARAELTEDDRANVGHEIPYTREQLEKSKDKLELMQRMLAAKRTARSEQQDAVPVKHTHVLGVIREVREWNDVVRARHAQPGSPHKRSLDRWLDSMDPTERAQIEPLARRYPPGSLFIEEQPDDYEPQWVYGYAVSDYYEDDSRVAMLSLTGTYPTATTVETCKKDAALLCWGCLGVEPERLRVPTEKND